MKIPGLEFSDVAMEASYLAATESSRKLQMRLALLMPALLYLIFSFLDSQVLSAAAATQARIIHVTQGVVFSLLVLFGLRLDSMRYHTGMIAGTVIVAWTDHLYLSTIGGIEALAGEAYLMIMWVWLVSGLHVAQSARVMLIFVIEFIAFWPVNEMASNFIAAHMFYMLAAMLIGSAGGYMTEYYRRQGFISEVRRQEMESQFIQSQKMEAIGTLAGGIAHNFNNTLAAMMSNIYLARLASKNNPDALKRLNSLEDLGGRSAAMIRQLLAFARKDHVVMQPFRLNDLLSAERSLAVNVIDKNIELKFDVCRSPLTVLGDCNQIQQVLMNLLVNARDAVEKIDHPKITCTLRPFKADAAFLHKHPQLHHHSLARLSVCDNGCGIDPEIMARVFEPFFTTKEVGRGTGLGLAMVFGSVNMHGGIVDVVSESGLGTCIYLYFPLVEEVHVPPDNSDVMADPEWQGGGTILLVDDDVRVLATTREVLESMGYRVMDVTDGEQALALFRQHIDEVSLVLTDIVMPGMRGARLARELRRHVPELPIVFATGYDPEDQIHTGDIPPDSMILAKPFSASELAMTLHQALSGAESGQ
ncbi:response regulator [Mariprofundus erugo]|uniref:response regulator n=1 Tax=Mariprofundus erugo TaxID=2528639 RepID=UPI001375AF1C|nr:response regulator [Mariprofundus erugo]